MKTIINIQNVTINLPKKESCEASHEEKDAIISGCHFFSKEKAIDGVYIYTESNHLWLPQLWGLSDETPQSIVLIKGDKKLCIALEGSKEGLKLLDSDKKQSSPIFSSSEEGVKDWNGYQNTEKLCQLGSPAGKYCKEMGDNWYIPSLGELNFIQENKNQIDAALTICGGEPFYYGWHWSSTRRSDNANFVLNWNNGDRFSFSQGNYDRVRPVSAFL